MCSLCWSLVLWRTAPSEALGEAPAPASVPGPIHSPIHVHLRSARGPILTGSLDYRPVASAGAFAVPSQVTMCGRDCNVQRRRPALVCLGS